MSEHSEMDNQAEVGLHLYRLDDGCEHVMAARDAATALRRGRDTYSIGECCEPDDEITAEMIPDDEPFTLAFQDGLEGENWPPEGAVTPEERDEDDRLLSPAKVTASAAEWARFCGDGVYVGGEEC